MIGTLKSKALVLLMGAVSVVLLCNTVIGCSAGEDAKVEESFDVVIVGGGISGLSNAFFLRDECDIVVLEKEQKAGGRILSGEHRGTAYARGAEYIGSDISHIRFLMP